MQPLMLPFYKEHFPNDLTNQVIREGRDPVASGGLAYVYRGILQHNGQTIKVAIKIIKAYSGKDGSSSEKQNRLWQEIKLWLTLRHANILPILGTTMSFGQFPAMVFPWVENGTLTSYLEDCHIRLPMDRIFGLLNDVASGLQYLHSRSIVHGDLSGTNVLICENGRAYISDYGLSTLLTELGGSMFATPFHVWGALRWTAPELLDNEIPEDDTDEESSRVAPTTQSDVYSFGSIMLQILSGNVPYHYYKHELEVLYAISKGKTPLRPRGIAGWLITEHEWMFIQRCWSTVNINQSRPSSEEIVEFSERQLVDWHSSRLLRPTYFDGPQRYGTLPPPHILESAGPLDGHNRSFDAKIVLNSAPSSPTSNTESSSEGDNCSDLSGDSSYDLCTNWNYQPLCNYVGEREQASLPILYEQPCMARQPQSMFASPPPGMQPGMRLDARYSGWSSNDLTNQVTRESHDPVACGGFADIYRGVLQQDNGQAIKVAIKAIKTYLDEDDNLKKQRRLRREIEVWLDLSHDNILPLLGTTMGFGRFPAMVCPWVENGTLTVYLKHCYGSLSVVEILVLLNNVAYGLQYLHSCSIVHGDLSGSNILIHGNGRACIADFGLSIALTEFGGSTFITSCHARGTLRWIAPELLDLEIPEDEMGEEPPHVAPTTQSDVYSFGMIMLQILSGQVPYHYYKHDGQVVLAISKGKMPRCPSGGLVTERRWMFIQRCWSTVDIVRSRPSSEEIVAFIDQELVDCRLPEILTALEDIENPSPPAQVTVGSTAPPLPVPSPVIPVRVHTPSHGHRKPPPRGPDEPETIRPITIQCSPTISPLPIRVPIDDGWIPRADSRTSYISIPAPHETTRPITIQCSPIISTLPIRAPIDDGWIPRADFRTPYISIPAPHELQRMHSPGSVAGELQDRRPTPKSEPTPVPPPVRSHDYGYQPSAPPPVPRGYTPLLGSRASTHVSQHDIVHQHQHYLHHLPHSHSHSPSQSQSQYQPHPQSHHRHHSHHVPRSGTLYTHLPVGFVPYPPGYGTTSSTTSQSESGRAYANPTPHPKVRTCTHGYDASPVPAGVIYPAPPVRPHRSHRHHRDRVRERDQDWDTDTDRARDVRDRDWEQDMDWERRRDPAGDYHRERKRERNRNRDRAQDTEDTGLDEELTRSPAPLQRPISLFDSDEA